MLYFRDCFPDSHVHNDATTTNSEILHNCLRRASLGACSRHASRSLRISSSITFQPLLGQAARALSPTA
jgi:hypothetical protein